MANITFSRKQYMAKECTHRQYYGQFVSNSIIKSVTRFIPINEITEAIEGGDIHLNSIKLRDWDMTIAYLTGVTAMLKEAGDTLTQSTGVCIAKEAATQAHEKSKLLTTN